MNEPLRVGDVMQTAVTTLGLNDKLSSADAILNQMDPVFPVVVFCGGGECDGADAENARGFDDGGAH